MNATSGEATQQPTHGAAGATRQRRLTARPDAVIFDMDGVVTDTADAHADAWKKLFDAYLRERADRDGTTFEPFDERADYREYVDGKPRFDGVESFLTARGIALPRGNPDDAPDAETVCGLGNRKNGYFTDWLAANRVRTYPATLGLIARLRAAGVKTGIFSSSRNTDAVLGSAGVRDLFDARVDGNDLEALNIPGKPDPAMLCETARRLGASFERTVVVEDAVAGVAAGAAGGFGLVVGIDRDDYGDHLAARGADIVVHDLGELRFDARDGFAVKLLGDLPHARECLDALRACATGRRLALFLDYDGTLTPIVEDFTKAYLTDAMRDAVAALAERCEVAIISGRDLPVLKRFVGLDTVVYAASHGFDIELPGERKETLEKGRAFLPALEQAAHRLEEMLRDIDGAAVERKRFAIAVHYRRVREGDVARVEQCVDTVVGDLPQLHKNHGKKVFEVQPRLDWDKGHALLWLLDRLGLDDDTVLPIYIGDDLTDEDAFRVVAGHGIGIAVGREDRPTSADYAVATTDEVLELLRFLFAQTSKGA